MSAPRFVRQILLPEIGDEGQRRIASATAAVLGQPGSARALAHEVAARYAEGAGFGGLADGVIDVEALAPAALVTHASARAVLAGSRAALTELRRAIGRDGAGEAR